MPKDGPSREPIPALHAAIDAVATSFDLDAALSAVLEATVDAFDASMGAIFMSDPDRPALDLVASHGLEDAELARLTAEASEPTHPFSMAAVGRITDFDREATTSSGGSFVGAYLPLVVGHSGVTISLGAMGLGWDKTRNLDQAERELLTTFATVAAIAVDRARLASTAAERSEWFERMAHTDPLTGLANERTVGRVLELEVARASRQGGELSLALFDVDDFRATNRDEGADVGDDVLKRVASVLAGSVRLVDTVGRIGGDEFILIAPGSAGTTVADRVIKGIAALPALAGREVSVSAGVARFPEDGADAQGLIAAATEALARARGAGPGRLADSSIAADS